MRATGRVAAAGAGPGPPHCHFLLVGFPFLPKLGLLRLPQRPWETVPPCVCWPLPAGSAGDHGWDWATPGASQLASGPERCTPTPLLCSPTPCPPHDPLRQVGLGGSGGPSAKEIGLWFLSGVTAARVQPLLCGAGGAAQTFRSYWVTLHSTHQLGGPWERASWPACLRPSTHLLEASARAPSRPGSGQWSVPCRSACTWPLPKLHPASPQEEPEAGKPLCWGGLPQSSPGQGLL